MRSFRHYHEIGEVNNTRATPTSRFRPNITEMLGRLHPSFLYRLTGGDRGTGQRSNNLLQSLEQLL